MMNEAKVTEQELAVRAVAPRVSQADVDAAVRNAYYHVIPDTMMTICALILRNGYTVIGKAGCVDPRNFQKDIGERIAREDAYGQVWGLLGYALADKLHSALPKSGNVAIDATGRTVIIGTEMDKVNFIARVCHEVNRAYCAALGDESQKPWSEAPNWQRESARAGVDLHLMGDFGPEASHISWMKEKEHPCMVPFATLPREQQAKDFIFRAVVHALK